MAGQLPKAYLRIDPNLDHTHPNPGLFVRLLCAAARQPARGRFKDRAVLDRCLGKKGAASALSRGDVVEERGGLAVDGWDIWQEGDLSVPERMRRYRNKRRNSDVTDRNDAVTPPEPPFFPPHPPISPEAEDSGQQGGGRNGAPDISAKRTAYVREVWAEWCRRLGKDPGVMSSSTEWALVCRWHDSHVPLRVVLGAMEETLARGVRPRSLTYLDGPVMEEAARVRKAVGA